MSTLTQSELFGALTYDPETGVFRRKTTCGGSKAGRVTGTKAKTGYLLISVKNKRHYAHRLAWLYVYGVLPEFNTDHINGNRVDNRIANLRDVSQSVNAQNTRHGTGVHFHKPSGRIKSAICVGGKQIHLGYFDTPEAANAAYIKAKSELHEGATK